MSHAVTLCDCGHYSLISVNPHTQSIHTPSPKIFNNLLPNVVWILFAKTYGFADSGGYIALLNMKSDISDLFLKINISEECQFYFKLSDKIMKRDKTSLETVCVCAPQEIIQQLVENSSTFRVKTEYAQDKYIKKKKKKWVTSTYTSTICDRVKIIQSAVISVISCSYLVLFQVWKYCDDSKTVLSHPGYDVPWPGTREDLVSQHRD